MVAQSKNQTNHFDIIISGGGVAGLTFGLLMADLGLDIAIIEPYPPKPLAKTEAGGRTVALMQSSLNILKAVGAEEFYKNHGAPLQTMRIVDDSIPYKQPQSSDFNACDIDMDHYGYNIPNSLLRAFLYEKAKMHKQIKIFKESKLHDYTTNDATASVRLHDDTTLTSQLIIGADGRNSRVRELAGIETWKRDYNQSAITFLIAHERDHNNIATEFHRPSGPLALVPLPNNCSSVVWVEKSNKCDALLSLNYQKFSTEFHRLTNNILGDIELKTDPKCWPLITIKAKSLTAPNMALIAEAAHVMSPITAQGLNLSLRDVASLAEVLSDGARSGIALNDPALLKRYEQRRCLDLNSRVHGVDSMMRLVSQDTLPIKSVRRAGFKALDLTPPLKRFAMHQGLAPPVDLGRLARGESL